MNRTRGTRYAHATRKQQLMEQAMGSSLRSFCYFILVHKVMRTPLPQQRGKAVQDFGRRHYPELLRPLIWRSSPSLFSAFLNYG